MGGFFIEIHETVGFEAMKHGFDKEEQARRKYRRSCDDAAAGVARQSQSGSPISEKVALSQPFLFIGLKCHNC